MFRTAACSGFAKWVPFANRVARLKRSANGGYNTTYDLIADASSGVGKTVFDDDVYDIIYGDEGSDGLLGHNDADCGSLNEDVYSCESFTSID